MCDSLFGGVLVMKCLVGVLSMCMVAGGASATQHQTLHEHGTAALNIVVSGAEIGLSLSVPSMDVVGFERPAADDDDRALVAIAISDLSKPLELFVLPAEAGCFTTAANVTLTGETLGQVEDTEDGADKGDSEYHSEFQGEYVIQCQDMDALKTIEFAYFDRFENTQNLKIQAELADGSHNLDVTRENPVWDLPKRP
ncbi:MAG: DUF2796 domain-containing protein [Pseudomonadota bacterium]